MRIIKQTHLLDARLKPHYGAILGRYDMLGEGCTIKSTSVPFVW